MFVGIRFPKLGRKDMEALDEIAGLLIRAAGRATLALASRAWSYVIGKLVA